MLDNIVPRKPVELVEFSIEFTDTTGSGYSFPCDNAGNVQLDNDAALAKLQIRARTSGNVPQSVQRVRSSF